LLESGFPVTAILCVNDITAIGVLKELSERKMPVPEQVSVTGFDNIQLAQFTIPSLTTVHIPRDRIAELSFESLVAARPFDRKPDRDFLLEPELILRCSSGPPPMQ
jgi:LacI family transcriptional regulator